DLLRFIAKVVEATDAKVVILADDELEPGDGKFINPDTEKVVDEAWEDDPTVTVVACFGAGATYDPVVLTAPVETAEEPKEPTEGPTSNNGSGGCDLGLGGVALLLAALLPLAKKH
ncbi:MAG: hypothetical protein IJ702_03085, partial [Fretibacterium sp.]|nr:hypothetical protein [Fretibacterium sp.]